MLQKYKDKREEGFTIIEVLIVLAIAGLIILIVFLAVPALQRNSRNTQRSNDASIVGGAVNECLNNKNGQVSSCDTRAKLEALGLDVSKLQQLTTVNIANATPSDPGTGVLDTIEVGFGDSCNDAGDNLTGTGTARQGVMLYRIEVQGSGDGVLRCQEI